MITDILRQNVECCEFEKNDGGGLGGGGGGGAGRRGGVPGYNVQSLSNRLMSKLTDTSAYFGM